MIKYLIAIILFFSFFGLSEAQNTQPKNLLDTNKIIAQNPDTSDYLEKLIYIAWQNYPDNLAQRYLIDIAEEDLFQRKWSWLDNLNLTYQYNPQPGITTNPNDNSSLPRFGIGISVNIGSIFTTPSKISQGKYYVERAKLGVIQQKLYIRTEVSKRYAHYMGNINLMKIRTQAADDAQATLTLVKHRYESGQVDLEEYDRALRVYTDNLERQAVSEMDMLFNKADLEQLLGIKLEDIK
jgi:outer membrane protein TolC